MGVDLQTYRCRIGAVGRGVKFGSVPSLVIPSPSLLLLLAVINMLLLISGIESNPGPFAIINIRVLTHFKVLVPLMVWMLCIPVSVIANTNLTNEVATRNPDINPGDNTSVGSSLTTYQIIAVTVAIVGGVIGVLGFLLTWFCTIPKNLVVEGCDAGNPTTVTVDLTDKQSVELLVKYDTVCSAHTDWKTVESAKYSASRSPADSTQDSTPQSSVTTPLLLSNTEKYDQGTKGTTTARLTVKNLTKDDARDYKCVVTTKCICSPCCRLPWLQKEKIVSLKVISKPVFTLPLDEEISPNEGDSPTLQCHFKGLYKSVTWYKDNHEIVPTPEKYDEKVGVVPTSEGSPREGSPSEGSPQERQASLTILDIKVGDNGTYKCHIKDIDGEDITQIKLKVTPKLLEGTNGEHPTIEDFKDHLINLYDQDKYSKIQSLPGECFLLDVSDKDQLMPIDFSAEKLEVDKRELALPPDKRELKYVSVKVESIEDILEAQQNDDSCRSVLVWADPGCGKSICIKSLVSKFAKKKILHKYIALFYLAVRDIPYIESPLSDILGCGPTGLGYVPDKYKSILKTLLESEIAMKTLFLVDGIDERTIPKSSELFQLIKGDLYPKVKVVITTRPESGTLRSLEPLDCTYKVHIKGTTEAGIYSYLEKGISSEGKDIKQEVDNLITKCKEQMLEFHLLKVPLYLTIVRYILIDFYNKHSSFKDYRIPKTTTDLFKVMIHIFLRVWLERIGKEDLEQNFNFRKSPLDQSSTLPYDMKRLLLVIGEMSYVSLQKQIYEFNIQDLNNYFIDADEVIHSGLFCFSPNKEDTRLFYRHKQISEFMAGMYLASKKMGDQSFDKRMTKAIENTEKQTLMDTFKGVESMMLFTFGLCPEFGVEILNRLTGHVGVAKDQYGGINVHYESRLYSESDNKHVSEAMRTLLVRSPLVERKDFGYKSPVSTVYSLCKDLTPDQRQTLLREWFGWTVYSDGEGWGIYKGKIGQGTQGGEGRGIQGGVGDSGIPSDMGGSDHGRQSGDVLVIRNLNDVYYFILHHCTFNNVKSVTLLFSDITDVNKISRVFPLVQQIDLGWPRNTELDEFLDTKIQNNQTDVHKHTSTITHVQIICGGADHPLPRSSVVSLIQQTELQSLRLHRVDIFSVISDLQGQILWSKLHTLEVVMEHLTDEECSKYNHVLSIILQCNPGLQSLTWRYYHNKTAHNKPWDFLVEVGDKLPDLHTLRLGQCYTFYDSPLDLSDKQPLWTTLPKVTTLGLGMEDVKGREAEWVGNIIKYGQHLNKVQIMYNIDKPDTVIQEVQRQITQCDPQSKITVEGWEVRVW